MSTDQDQPDESLAVPALDNPFPSPVEQAEAAPSEAQAERAADLDQQFNPDDEDVFTFDGEVDGDDERDAYEDPDDYDDPGEYEDPNLTVQTAISIHLAHIDGKLERIASALEALAEAAPSLMFAVSGIGDAVDNFGTRLLADAVAAIPTKPRPASAPPPRVPAPPARDSRPTPRSIAEWLERAAMPGDMGIHAVLGRYDNVTAWWATVEHFGISREVANRVLDVQHILPSLTAKQYISARLWATAFLALNVEVPPPHRNWAEVLEARKLRLAQEAKESK